ncbi:thiol-disulfide oxidoreductase DCC family protein [Rhodoferax sp.]|uniref:thiol-disulfide oxidoreductase DCC family protein n=1 Tax=Rhodoferax sp. TaxID=50421 RepID=UPI002ACE61F3|nr:thiol-disulfide oxidoreductase DCC family protein [Rhodoferax sp.]MDZ7921352.1 thiol-disulfide oxidoreductase DCC family protein [Rhodoferax sp.]
MTRVSPVPYSYRDDPTVPRFADDKPLIVFDGHCVLCSAWANFVLKHDRNKVYRLLAAQSPLGQALYAHYGLGGSDYQSNLLIASGRVYIKSDGTLRMVSGLGWPWRLVGVLRVLPLPWLDVLYSVVARNRLRWFGRREVCYFPAPEDADRFVAGDGL